MVFICWGRFPLVSGRVSRAYFRECFCGVFLLTETSLYAYPDAEAPEYAYSSVQALFRSPPAGRSAGTGPVHISMLPLRGYGHELLHGVFRTSEVGRAPNMPGQGPFEFPASPPEILTANTVGHPEPLAAAPEGQPYSRSG